VLDVSLVLELWTVWSRHLLLLNLVPVDRLKPWMAFDLFSVCWTATKPLIWVLVEELGAKVTCILRQEGVVKSWVCIFDISI